MEINFEPYEKVTFRSHLNYGSVEKFVSMIGLGTPPGVPSRTRLYWANGVLFRHFSLPPTDAYSKELIKSHLFLDHIEFAPMPEYQKEIQALPEKPLATIFVLDVSEHVVFDPLTKWIKENLL